MTDDILQESLSNRVVSLGLAALEETDDTPAHAPAVRRACQDCTESLSEAVVGKFDEATVARSLNELEANGHANRVQSDDTTPTGKGRPAFELAAGSDDVLAVLADDDAVASAVDAVRDER